MHVCLRDHLLLRWFHVRQVAENYLCPTAHRCVAFVTDLGNIRGITLVLVNLPFSYLLSYKCNVP